MESNSLKLTPEVCDNILQMMKSNDKSNLIVAEETIRNINVAENLPYLLIMYKESSQDIRKTVFIDTIKNKLNDHCKALKFQDSTKGVTYNNLYQEIKNNSGINPEAMDYFLNKFSESLSDVMISWGFTFMEDFKLKLIPRQ
jgi:hypothetical protein